MPTFNYTALKPDGSVAKGELTANDRNEAVRRLDRNGLQPVSLVPKEGGAPEPAKKVEDKKPASEAKQAAIDKKAAVKKAGERADAAAEAKGKKNELGDKVPTGPVKLKRAQIVMFTEELADLLGAGLQLEPALKIMESRDELSTLKDVATILRSRVRDGSSFSGALRVASPSFGELYCSLAAAGEISGALSTILRRQAEYLKSLQELQSRVATALIYPAFLIVAGVAVSVLFVSFLIPQLTVLLKQMGKELPPAAKFMLGVGDIFKHYWWAIIALVMGSVYTFQRVTTHPKYREPWDKMKLNLPLVGAVFSGRFFVQFLETLGNLIENGLPLLRAMELTRDATQNLYLRGLIGQVISMVGEGGSLSRALKKVGFFPPLLTDMITVGEQTGDLPLALRRTAGRYDKELEKKIDRVQAMIPHVVTVLMAGIVGSVAYMMVTVIMESISGMKGGGGRR